MTMEGEPGTDHQAAPLPPLPASVAQAHQQWSTATSTPYSWDLTLSSLRRNSIAEDCAFLPPFAFHFHTQDSAQWHSTSTPSEGNFIPHPPVESHHRHLHGLTATRNQVPQLATCFNNSSIPSARGLEMPIPHNSFTALLLQETSPNSWIRSPAREDYDSQLYLRPRTFTDTRGCVSSDVGRSWSSNIMNGMATSSMPEPSTTMNQPLHIGNHGLAVSWNPMEVPILEPGEEILSNARNSRQVEVPNRHEPRKTRRIDHSSERASIKSCTCKKSQCLMKFCACFAAGYPCGDSCACKDCRNDGKHEDEVTTAHTKILSRDPHAFQPKIIYTNIANDGNHDTSSMPKHSKGCNCKKSKCKSKYCECYTENAGCSAKCRCEVCNNPFNLRKGHSSVQIFQASSSNGNGLSQPSLMLQPSMNQLSNEIGGFVGNGLDFPTPWIGAPSLSSFELLNAPQFCPPHVPISDLIDSLPKYQGVYQ